MKKHNERCKDCKVRVFELLSEIFGEVYENYNLNFPTKLVDLQPNKYSNSLQKILHELQSHRGHENFVRAKKLSPVDFFIKNPGFILELDESQHFTKLRAISLNNYPDSIMLKYSKSKWVGLSDSLNKKDNLPPFRDEQRAWYDTLRDFAPFYLDLQPTVRLFIGDFVWCSLDPNNKEDIEKFKELINA